MNFAHAVRTAHRHRARQKLEQIADRLAAAADGHVFQHFGDQNEQGDDERGKKLADRGCRDDRNRHRQLHGHAAFNDILEGLLDDRPASDCQPEDSDDADVGIRLQDAEPHGCRSKADDGDANRLPATRKRGRVVFLVIPMLVLEIMARPVLVPGRGSDSAFLRPISEGGPTALLQSHDRYALFTSGKSAPLP